MTIQTVLTHDDNGELMYHSDHVAIIAGIRAGIRADIEALAKQWDMWADTHLDGEALIVANKCHFDLLELAKKVKP